MITFVIIKIATPFNVSAKSIDQRNKIKHDKYVFLLCRNMFTDCDVDKFWRDVVWHNVETSRQTVSILPFLELILKIEFVVVNFM